MKVYIVDNRRERNTWYVVLCQKYSRLRYLLRVKGWVIFILFLLVLQYSSVQTKYNKATYLSLPSYTGSALKRKLNFCNGYLSLLYFCSMQRNVIKCGAVQNKAMHHRSRKVEYSTYLLIAYLIFGFQIRRSNNFK